MAGKQIGREIVVGHHAIAEFLGLKNNETVIEAGPSDKGVHFRTLVLTQRKEELEEVEEL